MAKIITTKLCAAFRSCVSNWSLTNHGSCMKGLKDLTSGQLPTNTWLIALSILKLCEFNLIEQCIFWLLFSFILLNFFAQWIWCSVIMILLMPVWTLLHVYKKRKQDKKIDTLELNVLLKCSCWLCSLHVFSHTIKILLSFFFFKFSLPVWS